MTEFPLLMFRTPGPHFGPPGVTYDWRAARDEQHMREMIADGWAMTLNEAIDGEKPDESPVTREELEQKARELGIKFDGRTGDKKLAALIEAAIK